MLGPQQSVVSASGSAAPALAICPSLSVCPALAVSPALAVRPALAIIPSSAKGQESTTPTLAQNSPSLIYASWLLAFSTP